MKKPWFKAASVGMEKKGQSERLKSYTRQDCMTDWMWEIWIWSLSAFKWCLRHLKGRAVSRGIVMKKMELRLNPQISKSWDSCDLIIFPTKKRWRKIWRWRKETIWISPSKGAGRRQEFAEQRMESKNGVMSVAEVQGETQCSKRGEQWGRGGWKGMDLKRTDEVASLEWKPQRDNPKWDWDGFGEVDLVSVDEASFRMLGLQPA